MPVQSDKESIMIKLKMIEIDGTVTMIDVVEADEGFLHLQPGSLNACTEKGIHLYKDDRGNYYLADADKNVLAVNMTLIRSYIRMFIMK